MEVLSFTFQSFWHFAGVAILLAIVMTPVAAFLRAIGNSLGRR